LCGKALGSNARHVSAAPSGRTRQVESRQSRV
jgi:hypothetical protein